MQRGVEPWYMDGACAVIWQQAHTLEGQCYSYAPKRHLSTEVKVIGALDTPKYIFSSC